MQNKYSLIVAILAVPLLLVRPVQAQANRPSVTRPSAPIETGVSELPAQARTLVSQLQPRLAAKKCLVGPFSRKGSALNWSAETHVRGLVLGQLTKLGIEMVSDDPVRASAPNWNETDGIRSAASACGADIVLVGACVIGPQSSLMLKLFDGDGRVIETVSAPSRMKDWSVQANTPPANREMVAWAEQQIGKKIRRGECTDLAKEAQRSRAVEKTTSTAWGRRLPDGATPLPGDILQFEKPGATEHIAMVWKVLGPRKVRVLHQNWGGGEAGKVVAAKEYDLENVGQARLSMHRSLPLPGRETDSDVFVPELPSRRTALPNDALAKTVEHATALNSQPQEIVVRATDGDTSLRVAVGPLRAGQTLFLRYVRGAWTAYPRKAPGSPDQVPVAHDNVLPVRLCERSGDGLIELATVPGGTNAKPFSFKTNREIAAIYLNMKDSRADNNVGEVVYEVWCRDERAPATAPAR